MSRRTAVIAFLVALVLGALALRVWLSTRAGGDEEVIGLWDIFPAEDRLVLEPAGFADLPGWREDEVEKAVPALLRSCERIVALEDGSAIDDEPFAGTARDWKTACAAAAALPPGNRAAARTFFETHFRPWAGRNNRNPLGLFTGYYEPLLHGSRRKSERYNVPLYARPPELVMVDLGRFRKELQGQRIAGKVADGALLPFPDRREIEEGAIEGRKLEIVWVDDPVAAFFLHIQGSGRVRLAEGGELRLGYAAQNGHPYTAIGKDLIARGALTAENVSLQTIRDWLKAHPDEAADVMRKNTSYVFFQVLEGEGPLGAEGIPLTPGRSLAVDRSYLPLGVPIWLAGGMPSPKEGEPDRKLRRLLVAQDTGGAIRGPVRGDVFWGFGEEAEAVAGRMKHRGKIWLLLPKTVAPGAAFRA
jgi:membrane-bound lytic murein transglycosylase A